MFPIGFDQLSCHIPANFNRFGYDSPLGHQTGKIIRSRKVFTGFQSPDLKLQPIFL